MKSVLVHAVLALGGLIWAYSAWTAEEEAERPAAEVEVIDCDDDDFKYIKFESNARRAKLEMRGEGDDKYTWITSSVVRNGKAENQQAFVGSEAAGEFVDEITPLRALRSLGKVDKATLKEIGLAKPTDKIVLKCGKTEHAIAIGGTTFGSAERYGRVGKEGAVYLFAPELVRNLEAAQTQLMQRSLHTFELTDVDQVTLKIDGKQRTLLQRDRMDPQQAQWVDKAQPDKRNEMYGNWLNKASILQIQEYLPPKAKPGSDLQESAPPPKQLLTMQYVGDGEDLGQLVLVRVDGDNPSYYAKTETTRGWVRLVTSSARQVVQDARPVVGLEAKAEPEPAAAMPAVQPAPSAQPASQPAGAHATPVQAPPSSPARPGLPPGHP